MAAAANWRRDHVLWVEAFVLVNLAFLSIDIFLAHSENAFHHREEWIPFYFSLFAAVLLAVGLVARELYDRPRWWVLLGHLIGALAVLIGLAGVVYHLDSRFFYEKTILSLTYAAPFVAPLAYTGLGLLLIMNRMVPAESIEWAQWLLLLTLAGFFGNFVLSLTDHAVNGFFHETEWIPVASSALAVSFLLLPFFRPVTRGYLWICALVLLIQAAVGVLGFILHGIADLHGPSKSLFENVISGAPPMAPLLFPNLVILGFIALWAYARQLSKPGPARPRSNPEPVR
ncbi:MAG TPA: hypothetical protein VH477_13065 [Bryobacteraceae bacterium]|jgi:hypothetical protein